MPGGDGSDQVDDSFAVFGIQISGWFIREQNRRTVNEGTGYGNPLHFASGKLVGKMGIACGQADLGQKLGSPILHGAGMGSGKEGGEKDIFRDGQGRHEMKKLEDEADFGSAKAGEIAISAGAERFSVD
jgi:hypothetical protein